MTTFWHIDRGGFNRLKPLVKTVGGFDRPTLRYDAKRYRASQGITGSWKMQFFSIKIESGMNFLNTLYMTIV